MLNGFTQTVIWRSWTLLFPLHFLTPIIGHCTDAAEAYEKQPSCQKTGDRHLSAEGEPPRDALRTDPPDDVSCIVMRLFQSLGTHTLCVCRNTQSVSHGKKNLRNGY